ncbi:MAG: DUF6516 family protein [Chloroflexota bacterium]|nr:DUF6516 family protein [Chloroflexota bacterium]
MSDASFREYSQGISDALNMLLATGEAKVVNLEIDQRSPLRGFIKGLLLFEDDSELHIREFVDVTIDEPRIMYAYHYQSKDNSLIFRYDNALHRPALSQAEHKHTPDQVGASNAPLIVQVVQEIRAIL